MEISIERYALVITSKSFTCEVSGVEAQKARLVAGTAFECGCCAIKFLDIKKRLGHEVGVVFFHCCAFSLNFDVSVELEVLGPC